MGGVGTQGVGPTKAPDTEDDTVRAYDKADPKQLKRIRNINERMETQSQTNDNRGLI